jgi:chromosome partitioning protein
LSAPIIAFFNDRGGVGTTTLVYHLAWMFSDLGIRVLAADLDPQADLTAAFLGSYGLEISGERSVPTIYDWVEPLVLGLGVLRDAKTWDVSRNLNLLVGDLRLSTFEDRLSTGWSEWDVVSSFSRILTEAVAESSADVVLLDLGPNLGAINRAALLPADYLVVPLTANRSSLKGMNILETFSRLVMSCGNTRSD